MDLTITDFPAPRAPEQRDGTARMARVVLVVGVDPVPGGGIVPGSDMDLVEWIGIRLRRTLGESGKVLLADGHPAAVVHVDASDSAAAARILARKLLTVLREPYHLPATGLVRVRPSIGAASSGSGDGTPDASLLGQARRALEDARHAAIEPIAFA